MDSRLINPFVAAAVSVLQQEVGAPIERGPLRMEVCPLAGDDVTVLIGLAGEVKGVVMLSMSSAAVLSLASRMAGEEVAELNELSKSAVAELTNMISGRASVDLEQLGHACNISAPTVVTGGGTEISTASVQRLVVPLATPCGAVTLHVAIRPK